MTAPRTLAGIGAVTGALLTVLAFTVGGQGVGGHPPRQARGSQPQPSRSYGKLPLAFEANGGRTDARARFLARGSGYTLFLTPHESVLALHGKRGASVLRTRLVGAAPRPRVEGVGRLPGVVNSLIGNDRSKWRTGIPTYRRVRVREVYPGVDLVYYGEQGRLEYDFVLRPGADPSSIRLELGGVRTVVVNPRGDLMLTTVAGRLRERRPFAYQVRAGRRVRVAARFSVHGRHVALALGRYDRGRTLVIDPVFGFSTFLGGSQPDEATAIAMDGSGSTYVTGQTASTDFPSHDGFQASSAGGSHDAYVTKLAPGGAGIVYSTYLGGTTDDWAYGIAVDSAGQAVVAGYTHSTDFPMQSALDSTLGGTEDAFATKLSSSGAGLVYSTYLGGSKDDEARAVALDDSGNTYVAGTTSSTDFPLQTPYQSTFGGGQFSDAFLTKLFPDGTSLAYSTYLGGSSRDEGRALAVQSPATAYVGGVADSVDFPVINAEQAVSQGSSDGFVAKVDTAQPGASSLLYSRYLGGSGADQVRGLASSAAGGVVATGITGSTDFPVASSDPGGYSLTGGNDAFVTRFSANGYTTPPAGYSRYLGGTSADAGQAIAVDPLGNAYVAGFTLSSNFPARDALQAAPEAGDWDAFITKLKSDDTLVYSTWLGGTSNILEFGWGVTVDDSGRAYLAGTAGPGFPTQNALQPTYGGNIDGFVAEIETRPAAIDSGPSGPTSSATPSFAFSSPEGSTTFRCRTDSDPYADCSSPFTTSPLVDGPHTFDVEAVDRGGTAARAASRAFIVDRVPPAPFGLLSPVDGAQVGSAQAVFTWEPTSDASTSVANYDIVIDGDTAAGIAATSCSEVCSAQPGNPLRNGGHTWLVRARDAAGNTSDTTSRAFSVAIPPTATFTIAPNPALVGTAVSFDATGSTDPGGAITRYEWDLDGDGSFETDTGQNPAATKAYQVPGTLPVTLRVTNSIGLSTVATAELKVTARPAILGQFGVSINRGAQYTNSPNVMLKLAFPVGTSSILVSNDGGFEHPESFFPKAELAWKLDSSGPERLPKIVYVRYLPQLTIGLTFTDDIILDETPPRVLSASVRGTAAAARAAKLKTYKLKIKATDSNSGVGTVQVTTNKKKPGKLLKYKRSLTVRSAVHPKLVRARDRAGNYSPWKQIR